jgi:hypothetical protein
MSETAIRFALRKVNTLELRDGRWQIQVTIALHQRLFTGQTIAASEAQQFESTAQATVIALNQALAPLAWINLADYGQMFSQKVKMSLVAVIVELKDDQHTNHISGSSLVTFPLLHAPAKAVLNAVNRRLGKYTAQLEALTQN